MTTTEAQKLGLQQPSPIDIRMSSNLGMPESEANTKVPEELPWIIHRTTQYSELAARRYCDQK